MALVKVNEGFEANLMTNIWSWIFWLKIRILKKNFISFVCDILNFKYL